MFQQALTSTDLVLFGGNSFQHSQVPTQGGECSSKHWEEWSLFQTPAEATLQPP